mgnify:CR=1 FL=1|tara:strand:- start:109 stop:765 length:657 start_codon:yes stop_codon:yes gene_type:complete
MKKLFLTILFTLVLSGVASAFTSWNFQKGYVYIALKNNQNLDTQMSKQKKLLQGLNCSKGFHKDELKELPPGYAEDAPELLKKKYQPLRMYKITCLKDEQIQQKEKDQIMFTIKDKREQCEAIGFKPETEKFADCVLRLVELDVKQQQDQKITAAQNSGNIQIANQLLQMRNDANSQYLMDLGNQLLKPQQFNSNIYLPQTQRCFLQGFDSFAKMTCR